MSTIGNRIRDARLRLGISQAELGRRLGYSRSTINKIEKGVSDMPRAAVDRYAVALGVTSSYLMGWDDNPILQSMVDESSTENKWLIELEKRCKKMDDAQLERLVAYADFIISYNKQN